MYSTDHFQLVHLLYCHLTEQPLPQMTVDVKFSDNKDCAAEMERFKLYNHYM
jgi:hypothetical protein